MRPILFSLGSLNFYSYGFFAALGFIAGGAIIEYLAKKKKLLTSKHRQYFLIDALLLALIIGIISSRLLYILIYNLIFRVEPFSLVSNLLGGGFVFFGGLLAGLLVVHYWLKDEGLPTLAWFDPIMVGVTVGLTISEIGGYLNDGSIDHVIGFFGSLVVATISYNVCRTEKANGKNFFITLFLLFLLTFFLGFWRTEQLQWVGLGLSQYISLIGMLVLGGGVYQVLKEK